MLLINLPQNELFDEETGKFHTTEKVELELEHSLSAISKWESKYHKPFYSKGDKSAEETFDYIKCMIVSPSNADFNVVYRLTEKDILAISDYINEKMTATWFTENVTSGKNSSEVITAEIIYYWMISLGIDSSWERRHINQLLTLIRVFNNKNGKQKPMSIKSIMEQNRAINQARRAKLNSKG